MSPTSRRPARIGCWFASGLTAAVGVAAVATMADAASDTRGEAGDAFGALAGSRGESMAAALMAAADPGLRLPPAGSPPRLGGAGVS